MTFPFPIPFIDAQSVELDSILMTLLDVTMAQAARDSSARSVITIEMKTTFFQPALGELTGRGELLHATGTFRFVNTKPEPA